MRLHETCYKALCVYSEREHKIAKASVKAIKKKISLSLASMIGVIIFTILLCTLVWKIGTENGAGAIQGVAWIIAGGFIFFLIREFGLCYNDFNVVKAIEKGEYKVAAGKCYKIQQDRNVFSVYGVVGNVEIPNIIFYVDFDTIKAMPGENWNFMLVSAGKQAAVIVEAPDGKIYVDDRVQNMATYPYAMESD